MFSRLFNALSGDSASYPSVLLRLEAPNRVFILHVIPESSKVERIDTTFSKKIRYGNAKVRSSEQIGTVRLDKPGGDDTAYKFMEDLTARVKKLCDENAGGFEVVDRMVKEVLRPAAVEALRDREASTTLSRDGSSAHTLTLVYVDRQKAEGILVGYEPSSIGGNL
ncbi:unnamed protein product [Peniophora sp. CBMAI 1063]|nr:unnamed protein product [Peniophora sp. CBMAI 1063]